MIGYWWGSEDRGFQVEHFRWLDAKFKNHTMFAGDFDNDGDDDLFMYKAGSAKDYIFWSDGASRTFQEEELQVTGTYEPFVGDVDNQDGDDIFWYHASSGTLHVWWSNGDGTFRHQNNVRTGLKNYTPLVGDFDGQHGDDIFWYRAETGPGNQDKITWSWSGLQQVTWVTKPTVDVYGTYSPIVGDYNNDQISDIFWDRQGSTTDYIWTGLGNRNDPDPEMHFDRTASTAIDGYFTPVAGDFDNDGVTDIFWYRDK